MSLLVLPGQGSNQAKRELLRSGSHMRGLRTRVGESRTHLAVLRKNTWPCLPLPASQGGPLQSRTITAHGPSSVFPSVDESSFRIERRRKARPTPPWSSGHLTGFCRASRDCVGVGRSKVLAWGEEAGSKVRGNWQLSRLREGSVGPGNRVALGGDSDPAGGRRTQLGPSVTVL